MSNIRYRLYPFVLIVLITGLSPAFATPWTLESSIRSALGHAPELREAEARITASRAAVDQAGAWPNPLLELSVDDRVGRELGDGGRDVAAFGVTQPLPWGRTGPRRALAETVVTLNVAAIDDARLDVEYRTAIAFHRLQLTQAILALARESAGQAAEIAAAGKRRSEAGDIPRWELLRLELLAAQARQAVEEAEGEWSEAAAGFSMLVDLPPESRPVIEPLAAPPAQPSLESWLAAAEAHPVLRQDRVAIDIVDAKRAIARSERWPEFAVVLYREYEVIGGAREAVNGAGLTVQLPLWDRRRGRLDELSARGAEAAARLQGQQRRQTGDVRMRYLHLTHLVEQARKQRTEVLAPAREVLALARRAFETGEVELPALIEALDTARAAEAGHQQSLFNVWIELAHLRADAGVSFDHFQREAGR